MTMSERTALPAFSTDSLLQLEFAKVVNLVVGRTQTPYGKVLAAGLMPLNERKFVLEALQETEEVRSMLQDEGPLPLGSGADLLPHLETLQAEGLRLEPDILRDVQAALEAAAECRQILLNSESCSVLRPFARQLTPVPELVADIRRSIWHRISDNLHARSADRSPYR